ncbi:MAG: chromosomal replication initiator protein DnaA [Candidatus Yanofskybacteria bacterium CG10_big_fil_rev_8_21_14_0_10_36_16]|uniref:Chromosomal replication initiator protein DnaA n=1 Tax=Candidatus Yanofskybacteria bacterium CG10_big_fil_rev_8_21_14_0_10_36_16 TaxID=1975096 RepID=A0A2J0Q6G4_9BACT|nr:MAG: chromosomal replication initiator protein DnaA [Candidatus Yanofskybacteria bacterium CG10_big_fil_rev_8_21_14_0_10_36_16]
MTNQELWKIVLDEMELSLSKANFTTWFKNTSIVSSSDTAILINVPNGFAKEWLEKKFNKTIFKIIGDVKPEVREIKYTIGGGNLAERIQKGDFAQFIKNESVKKESADLEVNKTNNLNKRYTFDFFIVGSNNELAHAASLAVVKNLGKTYNPLFLYGGVGLGKTHLLHSIGNKIFSKDPSCKILYTPAEKITAEILDSLKNKTIEDLKQKYCLLDLLIIDDIQFVAGKEKTQEIIFSTFNELYSKNKQIILSSDRPPSAIPTLEERLRSRFEGGMIADIGIPDFETRLAILKLKATQKDFDIDDQSLSYIATNIQRNVRELEGALNRIYAFSQIYNKIPNFKEVKKLLAAYLSTPFKKTTHQTILKAVSDFYDVSINDIVKRSRKKEVVRPRQVCMFLLREETKYSFPEIGSKLGNRDHSTIIHGYEKIKAEEDADQRTKQELTLIKEKIYQTFDA